MVKKINVNQIFKGLQDQMEANLTFNRKTIEHAPSKGLVAEFEWIKMLSTYLPKRYCAESAFVIDSIGGISEQIDIVIFDQQYSPFILKQNGITYIPAECVYAILEVKQDLSKANIEYAQKKAESVRKLKRTSVSIPHAGGEFEPKIPARILAGIVATDGTISENVKKKLCNAKENKILNFGCSLSGKTFFNTPNYHPWDKNKTPFILNCQTTPDSLVKFFMNLLSELRKVGTVVAMDINSYIKLE